MWKQLMLMPKKLALGDDIVKQKQIGIPWGPLLGWGYKAIAKKNNIPPV